MKFIVPEARILVVDDNKISLMLSKNMISAFGIQVDCAESGERAIAMLESRQYHLVFMDYMMPGLDGVETTRLIRKMEGDYYQEVPIVALTGDDVPDEEMFYAAGMNDYLSKPLGNPLLGIILYKWLPRELIKLQTGRQETLVDNKRQKPETHCPKIQGIDVAEGIKFSGDEKTFRRFLRDFYILIDTKAELLETYLAERMLREYTIEVHALKHSARIIGATELSRFFQRMEQLGKAEDVKELEAQTPELLKMYRGFKQTLKPHVMQDTIEKKEVSVEEIVFYVKGLQEAVEAFDLDRADLAMEQLEECNIPEQCQPLMAKLKAAVADVAMENILIMSEEIIAFLQE